MDERSARLAENETVFRAGNERIDAVFPLDEGAAPYLCECGNQDCFTRVQLTHAEYEEVRSSPTTFFVAPGHEDLSAGEIVVKDSGRYRIVEKRGAEGEIAERTDPRSA
jgi:hypothetical protein